LVGPLSLRERVGVRALEKARVNKPFKFLHAVLICLISHKYVLHPVAKYRLFLNARFIQTALVRP
jgi:hypothetical protein